MHNEMLVVEGKKMSKSLGNFFTVRDLLDQGVPGEVIRFVLLSTHYSKPMDWTAEKAEQAEATLRKWRGLVAGIEPAPRPAPSVIEALADDLNAAGAIAELHGLAAKEDLAGLKSSASVLGLLVEGLGAWANDDADAPTAEFIQRVEGFITERAAAKRARDFGRADQIRKSLASIGVMLSDAPEGTSWMLDHSNDNLGNWDALK
jgi:cysteinyl-tRNA synthetase